MIFGAGGLTGNGALIAACNVGVNVIRRGRRSVQHAARGCRTALCPAPPRASWTMYVRSVISATDGTFPGGEVFGPAPYWLPSTTLRTLIPQDVKDQLQAISDMIDSGEIDPCAPFEGSNESTFCSPVVMP